MRSDRSGKTRPNPRKSFVARRTLLSERIKSHDDELIRGLSGFGPEQLHGFDMERFTSRGILVPTFRPSRSPGPRFPFPRSAWERSPCRSAARQRRFVPTLPCSRSHAPAWERSSCRSAASYTSIQEVLRSRFRLLFAPLYQMGRRNSHIRAAKTNDFVAALLPGPQPLANAKTGAPAKNGPPAISDPSDNMAGKTAGGCDVVPIWHIAAGRDYNGRRFGLVLGMLHVVSHGRKTSCNFI